MSNNRQDFFIWVISGPSGSGKTTLCDALARDTDFGKKLVRSVSCTTRQLRDGEKEGVDYKHLKLKEFLQLKAKGGFLESEKIFDTYYGTPKAVVANVRSKGRDLLLAIDVKGAQAVKRAFRKNTVLIFIMPPDLDELAKRLRKRSTEAKKDIEKRLKRVKIETLYAKKYDYIVVNDDVDKALNKIKSIITAKRCEVNYVLRSTGNFNR